MTKISAVILLLFLFSFFPAPAASANDVPTASQIASLPALDSTYVDRIVLKAELGYYWAYDFNRVTTSQCPNNWGFDNFDETPAFYFFGTSHPDSLQLYNCFATLERRVKWDGVAWIPVEAMEIGLGMYGNVGTYPIASQSASDLPIHILSNTLELRTLYYTHPFTYWGLVDAPQNTLLRGIYSPEGYELGDLWNVSSYPWKYGLASNEYDILAVGNFTYYENKLLYTFPLDYAHPSLDFRLKYPVNTTALTIKIYDNDGIYYDQDDLDIIAASNGPNLGTLFFHFDDKILNFRDFQLPVVDRGASVYTVVMTENGLVKVARQIVVGVSSELPDDFFVESLENNQEEINSTCDSLPTSFLPQLCKAVAPPDNYLSHKFRDLSSTFFSKFAFLGQTVTLLREASTTWGSTPTVPVFSALVVFGHSFPTFNFAPWSNYFTTFRNFSGFFFVMATMIFTYFFLSSLLATREDSI